MNQLSTFFGENMIQALGWTFLHSLWQGGAIALIALLALRMVPGRKPQVRYWIAFSGLLAILLAAVVTCILVMPAQSAGTANPGGNVGVPVESGTGFTFWIAALQDFLNGHVNTIVTLWLIGMLLLAIRLAGGFLYIQKLREENYSLGDTWESRLEAMLEKAGTSKPVKLAESALIQIPVAIGHLKPMILFPVAAVNQLSQSEVEAILAHELAHIIRNDFLHNIIQSLIEVVFYYNPAVWLLSAVVRHERENCCDDMAVALCGNNLTYAKALLGLETLSSPVPALVLPAKANEQRLLNRIKRVLNQPQTKTNLMEKMVATSVLLLSNSTTSSPDVPFFPAGGEFFPFLLARPELLLPTFRSRVRVAVTVRKFPVSSFPSQRLS